MNEGTTNYYGKENIKDLRLGRIEQRDPKSLQFPIKAMLQRVAYEKPRSKLWECKTVLDQGQEGSCVGHGFSHELIARPFPIANINHAKAVQIYKKAQTLDEWPGESYEGTSVLAGVKATQELFPGTIESYRWAFDIQDVVATLGYHGPIVIGINWYQGMYSPDTNGFIHVTGSIAGGHCLLLKGVNVKKSFFTLHNSWGNYWGVKGSCYISFTEFQRLINERADLCVPVNRGHWKK